MCNEDKVIVYDGVLTTIYGGTQTISVRGTNMTVLDAAAQVIESLIGPGEPVDTFYQENSPENDITDRIPEPKEDWTIFNLFNTHIGYASLIVKRSYGEEVLFHNKETEEVDFRELFNNAITLFSPTTFQEIDKEDAYGREKYLREAGFIR